MLGPAPLLQTLRHKSQSGLVSRYVKASDTVNLAPTLASSYLECKLYIRESLVNFALKVGVYIEKIRGRIPAAL